jgi:hypothetical protein
LTTKKKAAPTPTQTAKQSGASIYDPIAKQEQSDNDALLRQLQGQTDSSQSYLQGVGTALNAGRDATATVMNLPSSVGSEFTSMARRDAGTTRNRLLENKGSYTGGLSSMLTYLQKEGELQQKAQKAALAAARARSASQGRSAASSLAMQKFLYRMQQDAEQANADHRNAVGQEVGALMDQYKFGDKNSPYYGRLTRNDILGLVKSNPDYGQEVSDALERQLTMLYPQYSPKRPAAAGGSRVSASAAYDPSEPNYSWFDPRKYLYNY